jgi:hypothetical protein
MPDPGLTLNHGRWWGWQEIPPRAPEWTASPILMTGVTALKSGKSILRLEFVQAMHPGGAARRTIDLRVLHRAKTHLIGTFQDESGVSRSAVVSVADIDWIKGNCPILWTRRPPRFLFLIANGKEMPGPTAEEYLAAELGRTEVEVLNGATSRSFQCESDAKPRTVSHVSLDVTYSPFDSWLISRGLVPASQDDKWFIYLEEARLRFRRSWTGFEIYDVAAEWRGDTLHLGQAQINRDPTMYDETDDAYDRRLLDFIIDAVLLGKPAAYPDKGAP